MINRNPRCPECKSRLTRTRLSGKWKCSDCNSLFSDCDVVFKIYTEKELIKIYIESEDKVWLSRYCRKQGKTMSSVACKAIKEYLINN